MALVLIRAGSGSEDCIMSGDGQGSGCDSGHDGSDIGSNNSAVLVGLVLGVRRAVAKMQVGIALWIRVTTALEVVTVASPNWRLLMIFLLIFQ